MVSDWHDGKLQELAPNQGVIRQKHPSNDYSASVGSPRRSRQRSAAPSDRLSASHRIDSEEFYRLLVVHAPALGLVVSGDVVYNQTHMWLTGSTLESRASWKRALDAVENLGADKIIAGHRHPQAIDDDAQRQIEESRQYLADFEAALPRRRSLAQLVRKDEHVVKAIPRRICKRS